MTVALPVFAWAAAGVALATITLHLLAWRRPPETLLPTARFAPELPVRMVSRAIRPADVLLMALRVLLVLLVGFGLAGLTIDARREGTARVVVVDRSRSADGMAIADAARAEFRPGDALVTFDTVARDVNDPTADSIVARTSSARGSLSGALVAAVRAARRLERVRDSVEIVLVSPFTDDEFDAASGDVRRTWHGPVRLVRTGAQPNATQVSGRVTIRARAGDAVTAALALAGEIRGGADVRVARDSATAADSVWAAAGHTFVVWPSRVVPGWRRQETDTAFGVTVPVAGGGGGAATLPNATVVAPLERTMHPPAGRVVARWADGTPAATESALGAGCVRSVAVTVPAVGDLALTPSFGRFVRGVVAPCDANVGAPVADSILTEILPVAPAGGRATMQTARTDARSTLTPWLLGLALAVALAEMLVRRGNGHAAA